MSKSIRKEGVLHFVITAVAALVGAFNNLFIYTNDLELKGYIEFLLPIAFIIALPGIGASFVPIRFYPLMDVSNGGYKRLLIETFKIGLFLTCLSLLIFFIISLLLEYLGWSSPLQKLDGYHFQLVSITFCIAVQQIIEKILYINEKVAITTFAKNLVSKILIGGLFGLYILKYISKQTVINSLPFVYYIILVVFVYALISNNKPRLEQAASDLDPAIRKKMVSYGFIAITMMLTVHTVDKISYAMLGSLSTFTENGIFAINNYITTFILIPYFSVVSLFSSKISALMTEKKFVELNDLYKDTSDLLLTLGTGILLFVWANVDILPLLSSKMVEVLVYKNVILILGVGYIINMAFSINDQVITYSDEFKFNIVSAIVLLTTTVGFNFLLIPLYGIYGAAIANSIGVSFFNFSKSWYVKKKFSIKALSKSSVIVVVFGVICLGCMQLASWYIEGVLSAVLLKNFLLVTLFLLPVLKYGHSHFIRNFLLQLKSNFLVK